MTSQQILQADVLDILFEKRNKDYGAYLLRRNYSAQLLKAMGITALLVIALLFLGNSSSTKSVVAKLNDNGFVVKQVEWPKEKIEPPKPKVQPPATQQPAKTEVLLDKIKPVEKTTTIIATQKDLDDALPGTAKVDGPPATAIQAPPLPPSTGNGTAEKETEKVAPPLPNRQPQFPGGAEAWQKFLSRNLAPPADLEPGEKRSVLVRFSVDQDGVITNFVVVQSGGADFDNEVIRVLKKMPHWLPAIQNGRAVAVNFTQPVIFQAAE
ncbi:energy transducer TonB [Flavisolibacter ginsenosidimutans]|uniref:TonB family protein n=1 Tax=Flavisolibacter ginsenosidimutans TaxID=661481 RepID=A0A5B8UKL0_9BACT|nr:energy transducer TonB [Flavisolibacter ginsenosidimutans]QEC56550.1 TonB family protein [Flavisolibacter ginsenosidimutans]